MGYCHLKGPGSLTGQSIAPRHDGIDLSASHNALWESDRQGLSQEAPDGSSCHRPRVKEPSGRSDPPRPWNPASFSVPTGRQAVCGDQGYDLCSRNLLGSRLTNDEYRHEVPSRHGDRGGQNQHPELCRRWERGPEDRGYRQQRQKWAVGGWDNRGRSGGFPEKRMPVLGLRY